jgi:diacylglycerol kinase
MDKIKESLNWFVQIDDKVDNINDKVDNINDNVINITQRMNRLEESIDRIGERQENHIKIIKDNHFESIETIKKYYKKDKYFRNKFTLIIGIIILLLFLFIAFSL